MVEINNFHDDDDIVDDQYSFEDDRVDDNIVEDDFWSTTVLLKTIFGRRQSTQSTAI